MGIANLTGSRPTRKDLERFFSKIIVNPITGCWEWQAHINYLGYGKFTTHGNRLSAHQVAYVWFVGSVPDGKELDHVECQNRGCANPAHLEAVTHLENIRRGNAPSQANRKKTHCIHGHEFTPENTYTYNSYRQCRTCVKKKAQKNKSKHAADVLAKYYEDIEAGQARNRAQYAKHREKRVEWARQYRARKRAEKLAQEDGK